jgi:hypothetical protein
MHQFLPFSTPGSATIGFEDLFKLTAQCAESVFRKMAFKRLKSLVPIKSPEMKAKPYHLRFESRFQIMPAAPGLSFQAVLLNAPVFETG